MKKFLWLRNKTKLKFKTRVKNKKLSEIFIIKIKCVNENYYKKFI